MKCSIRTARCTFQILIQSQLEIHPRYNTGLLIYYKETSNVHVYNGVKSTKINMFIYQRTFTPIQQIAANISANY